MSYMGGKAAEGTAQTIINQQPPHTTYIEPFAGHAAVFRAKRPSLNNILIDRDPHCHVWLADHTSGNVEFLCRDSLDWLPAQHFSETTLIYCDPPYLIRSRDQKRARYNFEMTVEDHEKLLGILTSLPCMVQISAYADPLYSSYLRNWRHITFQSMTRGGPRTEHLWCSYPEPNALHTYSHLGKDYRERERIKRKTARWLRKLQAMPRLERLSMASAMAEQLSAPQAVQPATAAPLRPRAPAAPVSVLFAQESSNYNALPGVSVYDRARDARTFPGGTAVIAHPPCAQWGRLRRMATVDVDEKALGPFAVVQVRACGGVLEHPAGSTLWQACGLPAPGERDRWGGFTLDVDQVVWGHPAQKHTWLYVCGCRPEAVPPIPAPGRQPTHCITSSRATFHKLPELSKHGRESTPPALCEWLVTLAARCSPPHPDGAAARP